jgi:hypothetical protein
MSALGDGGDFLARSPAAPGLVIGCGAVLYCAVVYGVP